MAENRTHLIQLHKTTLEELRHHDTLHTQAFIGIGIVIPALLAAMSFLLGKNSPIAAGYFMHVKIGVFVVAIIVALFFVFTLHRFHLRFDVCISVVLRIEAKLLNATATSTGTTTGSKSELDGLLIGTELQNIKFEKWLKGKLYPFYVVLAIVLFIAFGFLLFKCIG